ncbi:MAG: S8 family serine peptidase [Bacteroidota bacterium]
MKILIYILAGMLLITGAHAQEENAAWQKIIDAEMPADLRISCALYQVGRLAETYPEDAFTRAKGMQFRLNESTRQVNVEVIYRKDQNMEKARDVINGQILQGMGFELAGTWKNRSSCWIKLEQAVTLAQHLPEEYNMELVLLPKHDNEGPVQQNSDSYVSGTSRGGAGRRIAVFDGAFSNLQTRINNGVCPTPTYIWANGAVSTIAGVNTGGVHGTACLETVFDHAPNAAYELYVVFNGTEMGQAVDLCETHDVDIITHSMSRYNTGWNDNTGAYSDAVDDFIDGGRLFFTSSGNRAESHWEGSFIDGDTDDWHNFNGNDEQNNITYDGNGSIHVALSWAPVINVDYDVYVYSVSTGNVVGSSTNTGVFAYEEISIDPPAGNYYIAVKKKGTVNATFEFFTHQDGVSDYEYQIATGSNTSPSNTTNNNCISVGAVNLNQYASAGGSTGIVTSYSSRGPTNSGNLVPKVIAPTATTTQTYGAFTGTSCSTPNAAGMAAAFWSANTDLDATGVRQIIFRMAEIYKDWGTVGTDFIYGHGGLYLYEYASNLRYMLRTSENSAVTNNTRPYYNMAVSQMNAQSNATVIILNNGQFLETGTYGNTAGSGLNKRILYRYPFNNGSASFGY